MRKIMHRTVQAFLHLIEYKEVLKCAVKHPITYAERALEAYDVVIDESIYCAPSFAGWQVNAVREA